MPRRYYRRRSANRDKYSIEQTNIVTSKASDWPPVEVEEGDTTRQRSVQFAIPVVNPVDSQGMRKVKHLTVTLSNGSGTSDTIFYAIVFVPQGYEPQPIQYPAPGYAINNYSANQFVMSSGVVDFTGGPCRIRSPLSRNLNSGDRIYLILATTPFAGSQGAPTFYAQVQYAITNQ